MVIDKNNYKKRVWTGSTITIEEVIKQIKMGAAKIYRNQLTK
jgi:hypothetical protein